MTRVEIAVQRTCMRDDCMCTPATLFVITLVTLQSLQSVALRCCHSPLYSGGG